MRQILNGVVSAVMCIALVVFTITVSIGLPIYVRPFYYAHIESLDLPAQTGHTAEEIRDAYDEVLDYLTLPNREFGTGVFRHSAEGESHFVDCKGLFDLNFWALVSSAAVIVAAWVLHKKRVITLCRVRGYDLPFAAGVGTLGLFAVLIALVSVDFDTAFVVFHKIFFPGKDNWLFSAVEDEIIGALPQEFFMHCAMLIGGAVVAISLTLIVVGIVRKKKCERGI